MSGNEESSAATADVDESEAKEVASVASSDGGAAKDDEDQCDAEHEEEIQEWNLRFLFQDYRFDGPVWQGLQDAGWTYHGGPYQSPKIHDEEKPMTFTSAKQICEYLDKFCIPPITNTLQLPPENLLCGMSEEEIKKGQELRKDVVRRVYKRMMARKQKGKQNTSDKVNTTRAEIASSEKHTAAERRSSRPRRSRFQQTNTATAFEKGADTFLRRSREKGTVSSQDIAFLKFPNVTECIKQFRNASSIEIEEIESEYKKDFDEWKFLLTTQNALLLYGFGSKRHILESFARNKLEKEGDVLTIDGFDRDVRIESILDLLVDHFLEGEEPQDKEDHDETCRVGVTAPSMIATHEVVQRATRVARSLAVKQNYRRRPLYCVFHNIDGPSLRSRDVQEALASLVAHSTIVGTDVNAVRLVASIDHVNASALLWDNRTSANFSWVSAKCIDMLWAWQHPHHSRLNVFGTDMERSAYISSIR